MADTAAHLVTRVLPRAPYRQWVFTVPKPLRLVLARDPAWTSWIGNACVRAIGAWQRRVARARGLRASRTGAVMFVHRAGELERALPRRRPRWRVRRRGEDLRFAMLPLPTSADVLAILDRIVRQVARRLAADARDDNDADAPPDMLAQVHAEAAATWRSPSDARPMVRGADRLRAWHVTSPFRSLHAGVVIAEHDRDALERLCRYGARPAFAQDRLAWTDDGRVAYRLKRPWPDGRTELVLPRATIRELTDERGQPGCGGS